MADIHIPFHEPDAIKLAVKYAKKEGARDVLIDGDALDHYQESEFCRVPNVATLEQELHDGAEFYQWIRKQFPKGRIVFKEGNHDERFAVKVHKCLPDVQQMLDQFTYERMEFNDLGIELVQDRRIVHMGYLNILHGHEFGIGTYNPVSPARTALLKAKECTLVAHAHQSTCQRGRTIRDHQVVGFSVGCLCHLHPLYRPINDWQHGFAIVTRTDAEGGFIMDNKVIIGGRCV